MEIEISKVRIGDERRAVDGATVEKLAESMQQVGLINPITVDYGYHLIAGAHRVAAAKKLGWDTMPCTMLDMEELQAKLAELDENLVRNQGSVIEQGEWLAEKKRIYEQLHPETRKGAVNQYTKVLNDKNVVLQKNEDSGDVNQHTKVLTDNLTVSKCQSEENSLVSETPSFVADTAAKTGLSERTIRRSIQIAENLTPDVKEFAKEVEITKTDALNLARKTPEEQREIVAPIREAVQAVAPAERKQTAHSMLGEKLHSYKTVEEINYESTIYKIYADAVKKPARLEMQEEKLSILYDMAERLHHVTDYPEWIDKAIANLQKIKEYFLHPIKVGGLKS